MFSRLKALCIRFCNSIRDAGDLGPDKAGRPGIAGLVADDLLRRRHFVCADGENAESTGGNPASHWVHRLKRLLS
jgi:hypothetical protein